MLRLKKVRDHCFLAPNGKAHAAKLGACNELKSLVRTLRRKTMTRPKNTARSRVESPWGDRLLNRPQVAAKLYRMQCDRGCGARPRSRWDLQSVSHPETHPIQAFRYYKTSISVAPSHACLNKDTNHSETDNLVGSFFARCGDAADTGLDVEQQQLAD